MNTNKTTTISTAISTAITTAVSEVVLLEDRAQILRTGHLELQAGFCRIMIENVAPILADKTLSVHLPEAPEVTISDVRVVRLQRTAAELDERDLNKLLQHEKGLRTEYAVLSSRRRLLKSQLRNVELMAEQTLSDIATDVSWAQVKEDAWSEAIEQDAHYERTIRDETIKTRRRLNEIKEALQDLEVRMEAGKRPDQDIAADIYIDLLVPAAMPTSIEIRYVVPAACWRPQHSAQFIEDEENGDRLEFSYDASVWQRTGEDWVNATLKFSTQRASLGFEPPLLMDDILSTHEKPETVEVEIRDQKIVTAGLGSSTRISHDLPGIDDGGEVLKMTSCHKVSIPSDGRPHRVEIVKFSAPAKAENTLIPEIATAVIRKINSSNTGPFPVLAGPVDLIAENGLIGHSSTMFIASNEKFALGFGPNPSIRVRRRVDDVALKSGALSRHNRRRTSVTLLISNISADTESFTLSERIPISEIESVKILFDPDFTTGNILPDKNGILVWRLELEPGERKKITLRYTLEKKKDIEGV